MKSILTVLGGILWLAALVSAADAGTAGVHVFPFVKGHYWLYDGRVAFGC